MSNEKIEDSMIFTGHSVVELSGTLKSIVQCPMPIEIFDAFLAEYARTKSLSQARMFAMNEWDC